MQNGDFQILARPVPVLRNPDGSGFERCHPQELLDPVADAALIRGRRRTVLVEHRLGHPPIHARAGGCCVRRSSTVPAMPVSTAAARNQPSRRNMLFQSSRYAKLAWLLTLSVP